MSTIRLFIADEEALLLDALESLLRNERDMAVVGRGMDEESALCAIRGSSPDVVLLARRLSNSGSGIAVARRMRDERLHMPVVLLASSLNESDIVEGLRAGISGVLLKTMPARLLVQCIRKVHAGGQWVEKDAVGKALLQILRRQESTDAHAAMLSIREIDVVKAVAGGMRNREVAQKLFISESTVKVHLNRIFDKLNVTSRVELSLYAREHGLL